MSSSPDIIGQLPEGSRVAVVRLRSLGDCVLTTPAIQLLEKYRPDLDVRVVAEDRFRAVFARPLEPTLRAVRAFDPQLCLNLHGGSRSARLTALSGARWRAGLDIFRPAWVYNIPIPTAQETMEVDRRVHTAEHMASAMFHLGVPPGEIPRASVPAPAERSRHAPPGEYAVIHPFASAEEKTWPAAFFVELAKQLTEEVVFIGGPGDDLSRFQRWRTVIGAPIDEVAALVRDASVFIGNDSGPAHLAAAFGVPELIFFGDSDMEIWQPWRTPAEVLKAQGPMHDITVDQALRALGRLRVSAS